MSWVSRLYTMLCCLVAIPAMAEDFRTVTVAPNVVLQLQGIAVAQELRSDYYIGAVYLPDWSADLAQAASETVPKRMSMKVLADRLSAREFQRHWKERIALNNPRPVWQPQGERILKFANAFRDGLLRGDQIDFDFLPGQGTNIRLNGQLLTTVVGDGFYPLLLSAWLGDIPPTRAFQTALRGAQDSDARARLIQNFEGIPIINRSLGGIQQVANAAAPAVVETALVKPVSKPVSKPAVAAAKPPVADGKPAAAPTAVIAQSEGSTTSTLKQTENASGPVAMPAVAESSPVDSSVKAVVNEESKTAIAVATSEVDEDLLLGEYKREALQKIRKQLEYPARAWRLGLTGSGVIRIRIAKDGRMLGSDVVVPTGQMLLDGAMVSMLERSLPLPALPAGISSEEVAMEIPVDFVR